MAWLPLRRAAERLRTPAMTVARGTAVNGARQSR